MKAASRSTSAVLVLAWVLVLAGGCSQDARKERALANAERYYAAGQNEKAEIEYLNVLKLSPLHPQSISRLGLIYYRQGKSVPALAHLQKAAELEPESIEVRVKLGLANFQLGNAAAARKQAEWVLEQEPGNEEALLLLVDSAAGGEQMQETGEWLEGVPDGVKATAGYHLARGSWLLRQQKIEQAQTAIESALAVEPDSSAAHDLLGNLHFRRNEPKKAGAAWKKASELAPVRSARRLSYARYLLQSGEVEGARRQIEAVTQEAPDYVPAWTLLAQIAFSERETEDSAALLKKVLAKDPSSYNGLLLEGRLMLAEGKGTNAVAHFERMAETMYGGVPQVHYQLALAHLTNDDASRAMSRLERAVELNPNYGDAVLLLTEGNLRNGDAAPAIARLSGLIERQPQLARAHLLLGKAYLGQRNEEAALEVYRRMADLFADNPQPSMLRGLILVRQGNRAEARAAFERALEIVPDYVPVLEQLVDLAMLEEDYGNALERVQAAIERTPDAAAPWLLLAKVRMFQNDLEQAEAALVKANEKDPDLRMPYYLLARVYLAADQKEQALARLHEAVATRTNDVTALMQIGMIEDARQNHAAARRAYEDLLEVDPRFTPALNNLAYLYSERVGDLERALELAERAREAAPDDPSVADTLGWILHRTGDHAGALRLLRESAEKLPDKPEVQFHLGMTHYRLGDVAAARTRLQRALESEGGFAGREEAQRRLALLNLDLANAGPEALANLKERSGREPDDPVVLDRLAELQERNGSFGEAAATCERALALNPGNARIQVRLAHTYARLDRKSDALEMAKRARAAAPDDAGLAHLLGRLVYGSGDYRWAASLLAESARNRAGDPELMHDLAWAQFSLGKVEAAIVSMKAAQGGLSPEKEAEAERFLAWTGMMNSPGAVRDAAGRIQEAIGADPDYVPVLMAGAMLQEEQANPRAALQLYERILDRFPDFSPAIRNLALLHFQHLKDDRMAYELATRARADFPADPEIAKALGVLSYRRGNYARSAQLLNESARQRSEDGEVFYYLGMTHRQLQEPRQSREALQRALALNVPAALADEAHRVMAELQ